MKRADVLDAAKQAVTVDRAATHGKPEDTFYRIADLWSAYLGGRVITSYDVAHMMILLKVARAQANPWNCDNQIDMAGYAACAAELVNPSGETPMRAD